MTHIYPMHLKLQTPASLTFELLAHMGLGVGRKVANYGPHGLLYTAHQLGMVCAFSNGWKEKNKRRVIFCQKWALREILISVSLNKVLLEHRHPHLFPPWGGCSPTTRTELSSRNRDHKFYKGWASHSLSPYRKSLLTPILGIKIILHVFILWEKKRSAVHVRALIQRQGVPHRKDHCPSKKRNWQMGFKLSEGQGWLCVPSATAVGGTSVCSSGRLRQIWVRSDPV